MKNEEEVSLALKEMFKMYMVKREGLWIASKLWVSDCARSKGAGVLDNTLQGLQFHYIDFYLMHWSNANDPSTWKAMELGNVVFEGSIIKFPSECK
ncbi:hypothetical protein SUGI_0780600 [Cryptomeria japonica]|nr:hypothetical protein SUGI_0780600 [Cryptomeria japonica]